jgi:Amt family ammonium transporter
MNAGDTAWLLVSAALVMLMTPGLALFYGGMVQGKNVLSTFMHSFFALGLVTVQFVLVGYSLCFGTSWNGVIGGLDFLGLEGVGTEAAGAANAAASSSVPHLAFMAYQCMFAVIAPALISGAYAERMRFSAYVVFTLAWTTLVYDPIAHWSWAPGGWLLELGAIDFAGGTVVHLSTGVSALVCALVLGKRRGYPSVRHPPHNLTMTVLGAAILWFGWFGFNSGAASLTDGRAALTFVNTHIAAAAGGLAWVLVEGSRIRKTTMLGVASGIVAGLVAITPAAGFVSPMAALAIGAIAGAGQGAARLRRRARCVRRPRRRRCRRRAADRAVRARHLQRRQRRRPRAARQAGDRGRRRGGVGGRRDVRAAQGDRSGDGPAGRSRGRARRPRRRAPRRVGLRQPERGRPRRLTGRAVSAAITYGWQLIRENRLLASAKTDRNLSMRDAAPAQVVSLDEYRRARSSERRVAAMPRPQSAPALQMAPAVWVYWVPVWVW